MRQRKLILSIITLIVSLVLFYQGLNSKSQPLLIQTPKELAKSPEVLTSTPSAEELSQLPPGFTPAKVIKVTDGDTIDVELNGQKFTVRYIGIDTPETVDPRRPVGCFGKEASDENKKLVVGSTVFLERDITETDKYGRILRYVYLSLNRGDFLMVNDYLVRQGFAMSYSYPPDIKYQSRFNQAQEEARVNNRGLWEKCRD